MPPHTNKETTILILKLPEGSYVVPVWVCKCCAVRGYNILPKKEPTGGSGYIQGHEDRALSRYCRKAFSLTNHDSSRG